MNDRPRSWAFRFESIAPVGLALAVFLGNWATDYFALLGAPWKNRLLDGAIVASSVLVAYWGTAETILFALDSKRVVERLRKLGYATVMVRYYGEALLACFAFLVFSVVVEPLEHVWNPTIVSSIWLALAVWAVISSVRGFTILNALLRLAAKE